MYIDCAGDLDRSGLLVYRTQIWLLEGFFDLEVSGGGCGLVWVR